MARLIKIAYGGITVGLGGNASITLTDKYTVSYGYTEFAITWECVVRSSTRATFLTAEAALIAALRKPDQDLDVELGGTNRHAFAASDGTGFNARATCAKVGGAEDTANSARYRCSVSVQLPADLTGRAGRQTSMVSVDATPAGRRTVTISGTYTALSTASAAAQYVTAGTTYCDTVLSDVGGTYELLTPLNSSGSGFAAAAGFRYDDQNKVLSFSRSYREVIFNQGVGTLDVAAIKDPSFVVIRITPPAEGDPTVTNAPFVRLRGVYSCWVDKDTTTDLLTLYTGTIRPHLLAQMDAHSGAGSSVVVHDEPAFDKTENRISATLEAVASPGSGLVSSRLEVEDEVTSGKAWAPVWSSDPFAVDEYSVPALHLKTVRRTTLAITGTSAERPEIPEFPGFSEVRHARSQHRESLGGVSSRFSLTLLVETFLWRKVTLSTAGGGGGGGGLASQVRQQVGARGDMGLTGDPP